MHMSSITHLSQWIWVRWSRLKVQRYPGHVGASSNLACQRQFRGSGTHQTQQRHISNKHSTQIRPTHHSNCKTRLFNNYIHVLKIRTTDQLNCGNWIDRFEICCTPREEKISTNNKQHVFFSLFVQAPEDAFLRVPQGVGSSITNTFSFAHKLK